MLDQAIIDAAALREAALKNAEQAIIEKYAPDIKAAVDSLLEGEIQEGFNQNDLVKYEGRYARVTTESENGNVGISFLGEEKTQLVQESELQHTTEQEMLQEEEAAALGGSMATSAPAESPIAAPFAAAEVSPTQPVDLSMEFKFTPEDFGLDMGELRDMQTADPSSAGETPESTDDLIDDLGIEGEDEGEDLLASDEEAPEEDLALKEILDMLSEIDTEEEEEKEEEVLEEELTVDMGEAKPGWFESNASARKHQQEMELAKQESTQYKEENEKLNKKLEELQETLKRTKENNKNLSSVVDKLKTKLSESLLSNAKLIYSNRILGDASLNERQKTKIVEAIAKAKTPDEAKSLCEALKTTVGSTKDEGPKSLSESVQRRSNLSSVLTRNNKEKPVSDNFSQRMKKLAGIS